MPDMERLFLTPDFRMIKIEKLFSRQKIFLNKSFYGKTEKEGAYGENF